MEYSGENTCCLDVCWCENEQIMQLKNLQYIKNNLKHNMLKSTRFHFCYGNVERLQLISCLFTIQIRLQSNAVLTFIEITLEHSHVKRVRSISCSCTIQITCIL